MRYMRLIRSRMYQRPLVGRICCAASMVSSLSPCVYFVLATAIWPAGALGGGLFVYADRVIQVKQGMRGKPGGVHIFHLVRTSPSRRRRAIQMHVTNHSKAELDWRFDDAFDGAGQACAHNQ